MRHTSFLTHPRRRLFSLALVGCACTAALPTRQTHAQTANAAAPVASNGINIIETGGVYPTGTAGSDHYLNTGASNKFPSFSVLDFTVGSFGLPAPVSSVSNVSLTLTESDFGSTLSGGFTIYLTEDTNSIATANGGSPLAYQTANTPSGLGTQLGDSTTLFPLATFTSSASTSNTTADVFTLTLTAAAQTYFDQQLNAGSTSDLRLVLASNTASGYATFLGNTSAVPAASEPTLSFTAALNQPSLSWTPGGASNTNGGSGTWLPAGTAGRRELERQPLEFRRRGHLWRHGWGSHHRHGRRVGGGDPV